MLSPPTNRRSKLDSSTSLQWPSSFGVVVGLHGGLFSPTVHLPGGGKVVLIDAVGRSVDEILDAVPLLPPRSVIATTDPHVGPLRSARLTYEYLPGATAHDPCGAEDLAARLPWIDYVYGIDEVVRLSDLAVLPPSR